MNVVWVFDLDGTLITSGIDYARSVLRWGLMFLNRAEHRAPHYEKLIPRFIEHLRVADKERFPTMRADRNRWPGSMVEAYRRLCAELGMMVDPALERATWKVGESAISGSTYRHRSMLPGAAPTLRFLKSKGDPIFCVTAGDPVVQWKKWRGYQLRRFFPTKREFRVVWWEKDAELRSLQMFHSRYPILMVGDSIGSDLVPAAKFGYKPIFIPHPSVWDHGQLVNDAPEGTIQLERIADIRTRYSDLVTAALLNGIRADASAVSS